MGYYLWFKIQFWSVFDPNLKSFKVNCMSSFQLNFMNNTFSENLILILISYKLIISIQIWIIYNFLFWVFLIMIANNIHFKRVKAFIKKNWKNTLKMTSQNYRRVRKLCKLAFIIRCHLRTKQNYENWFYMYMRNNY